MKPGDLVIHRKTLQRLTVKALAGQMVLCGWMETDKRTGDLIECSGAHGWEDLREPTAVERIGVPKLITGIPVVVDDVPALADVPPLKPGDIEIGAPGHPAERKHKGK
jgi:hypothetical protein